MIQVLYTDKVLSLIYGFYTMFPKGLLCQRSVIEIQLKRHQLLEYLTTASFIIHYIELVIQYTGQW